MSKGLRPKRSVRTAMQKEIASYAIAQLEEFGFDKAIEEAKASMARYSVTPNMLVIAPQTSLYMNVGGMERIKYDSYGQKGPSQFDAGVAGFEAQQFRGCGVFTSPPFDNGDESDAVQMLERSTQIGEFYRVKAPETKTTGLPATYLDLTIYDEEKDKLVHIPFATLLKAAIPKDMDIDDVPWGGTGTGVPTKPTAATAGKTLAETWVDLILKKMETADRYMEIEIVVARPFIEHQMLSAVLTVAGRDTGATLYGPADMQVSANTSVKTIEGYATPCRPASSPVRPTVHTATDSAPSVFSRQAFHLPHQGRHHVRRLHTPFPPTFRATAWLLTVASLCLRSKPQNVYVIRDVMCNGYVAGCNTKFFGMDKDTPHPTTAQIKKAMEDRLAFDEPEEANWGSMLAFAVEYGDGETRDQVISISSRVLPWELGRNGGKEYFPGGKKGWETYQEAYGLDSIHYGEDPKAAEAQDFLSAGSVNNALCFVGPHRVFSPWGMAGQEELVPGQGHFGSDARPGVRCSPRPHSRASRRPAHTRALTHPCACLCQDARWRRGESVSATSVRNSLAAVALK